MEAYSIHGTTKTPEIVLDPAAATLEIKGRCIPENTIEFFGQLFSAVAEFAETKPKKFDVTIHLEYFNTSSSKCLLDLFKKTEELLKSGTVVLITWIYDQDDDEWLEVGKDYESISGVPFKYIEVE